MQKSKRKLIVSVICLVLVSSVLGLSVFEHAQSGFSIFGRSFFGGNEAGNFKINLFWTDDPVQGEWKSAEAGDNTVPFDSGTLWEPDHYEVRYFKVDNAGDYDFQYNLGIETPDRETAPLSYIEEHPVCGVIDVFAFDDINGFDADNLSGEDPIGTLEDCFVSPNILSNISLDAGESKTCALVFKMQHEAGNEYQGAYDGGSRTNNVSFRICASASAEEPDPGYEGELGVAPELSDNTEDRLEKFIYRVGTGNSIYARALFGEPEEDSSSQGAKGLFSITASAAGSFNSDLLTFAFEKISGTSNTSGAFNRPEGTYTAANDFLEAGYFTFTGNGVIKVTMNYGGEPQSELYLEVVPGNNITEQTEVTPSLWNSGNVILYRDVNLSSNCSLSNGRILYGNGFTVERKNQDTSGATAYLVNINNGTIDNAVLKGEVYTSAVQSGTGNQGYAPGVFITGDANIYNSFISECRYAVQVSSGNVVIKNSTISGGAIANIAIDGGNVVLENCVTSTSVSGLKGLGVRVTSANCSLTIKGSLNQHNWLKSNELPSQYQSLMSSIYNDSTYAYTPSGSNTKYVNMGIAFVSDSGSITAEQAKAIIKDSAFDDKNNYGYIEKTYAGVTGAFYTAKAVLGSSEMLASPDYSNTQYYSPPAETFDFTNKNYIPKVAGDNNYCYYDNNTGTVNISFDKTGSSPAFTWDPMILTVRKYGSVLPGYTVTMGGTDYTGSTISFAESGSYQVVYTYTDENQYVYAPGTGLENPPITYTQVVNISVNAVENDAYNALFEYVGDWANTSKQVITNQSHTYVMPNVNAAVENKIGSRTIEGKTIYYPIVDVGPTDSSGNTAYSDGKGYYFAPVFNAINITDYNQETGASQYTYNTSSTTWPHGKSATNGPDTAYFSCGTEKTWGATAPYSCSLNSQYYKYAKSNKGLCYTTNDLERDKGATEHLVTYHYVSNDGETYYYCIYYRFSAFTYKEPSTCFAEGTKITLARGGEKPIEDINSGDSILSYNFFTGNTEAKNIAILVNHGKDCYKVLNLKFKDGTLLRIIGDHGVFDYTLNKYVYLTEDNCKEYIGHRFIRLKDNGKFKKVKLTGAFVTAEYTTAYSITSAQNSNAFANNMLTVAPPDDFYNWIDMGGKMRYDTKQLDADVKKYGLYDYSVFEDYVSYYEFVAFNGPYLKVAVEKGKFTFDDIIHLIELYGSFMQ